MASRQRLSFTLLLAAGLAAVAARPFGPPANIPLLGGRRGRENEPVRGGRGGRLAPEGAPRRRDRGAGPAGGPLGNYTVYDLLRRDFIFIERAAHVVFRLFGAATSGLRSYISRTIGYPSRVVVVELKGIIAAEGELRAGECAEGGQSAPQLLAEHLLGPSVRGAAETISLERVDKLLTRAFSAYGAKAVCLLINSPGGSPAQSSLIYQRLRALRERYTHVALLAFVEDAAVSGGFYIACAADEIVADRSSLVGSVGVISRGFGYVRALKKQGLSRRVQTAGEQKGGIDPYLPLKGDDLAAQRRLLEELHANFISDVKAGRGERLRPEAAALMHHQTVGARGCLGALACKPSKRKLRKLAAAGAGLFDGSVYSGEKALELGLVDDLGEMRTVLQARYGKHVKLERMEEEKLDYAKLLRWLL